MDPYLHVTVIIPAYNSEQWIGAAIDSLLKQTWPHFEIIVVDDDSTDGTYEKASRYGQEDARIRLFRKKNGGASSARNYGYRNICDDTQYLFFLDADDQLLPHALEKMVGYMEEHPQVGLLGCQFNYIDYDSDQVITARRTRYCKPGLFPRDLRDDEFETPFEVFYCATGQGPYALYRRSVYERTAGWSEDFWGHNDTDMFIQMALEAPVHYLPDVLYLKKKVRTSLEHRSNRGELYAKLRQKWDNYQTGDPQKRKLLDNARSYYIKWHRPCRDLKVGMKALKEFLQKPTISRAKWCWKLFSSGLSGFFLSRLTRNTVNTA